MKKYVTLLFVFAYGFSVHTQHLTLTNDLPDELTKQHLEQRDQRVYRSTVLNLPMYYKTIAAVYQLDSMKSDSYDNNDSTWYWSDLDVMEYDANKLCVLEIDFDFHNGIRDKDYGYFYDYDANGNFISEIGASWDNGQWDTSWKEVYYYSATDQYLGAIEYDYNNGTWEKEWKSEYVYDANGYLIERTYSDWDNGQWELYSKTVQTNHTDGRIESEVYFYKSSTFLEPGDSAFYEYNSSLELIRSMRYDWDDPVWDAYNMYEYVYYTNSDLHTRTSYYKYSSTTWDTSYKYIYNYAAPGYVSERIEQDWDNGSWVNSYKDGYTYDMNYVYPQITANPYYLDDDFQMFLTEFEYEWNEDDAIWELEYRDYFHWSHTGIGIEEEELSDINVYPVPTANLLTIKVEQADEFEYQLYDMNGRLISEKTVKANETTLQLKGCASGLYMLHVTYDATTSVHKVIVQ
jgi:hypothetical protein